MENPKISVICSSNRPKKWKKVCKDLSSSTEVDFEILFAGPKKSKNIEFNDRVRFIKNDFSYGKSAELAVRQARGEYVMPISDDVLFSDKILDKLYFDYASRIRNKCVVVSPIMANIEGEALMPHMRLSRKDLFSPILTIAGLYNRRVWNDLGGLDMRLPITQWDIDMSLRFYQAGGAPFLAPDCYIILDNIPGKLHNTKDSRNNLQFLQQCWMIKTKIPGQKKMNVKFLRKRSQPVRSMKF
jgi:hypothetical protein